MDDVAYIVTVLVVAIGGLAAVAYLLERRSKASSGVGPALPALGPAGKILLWVIRGLVAAMVLSIIGVFVFRASFLAWVALGCLVVYFIVSRVFQIVRAAGK